MVHATRKKRYIDGLLRKGMRLGKDVEIVSDFFFDPSHCYLIKIGDQCTICPGVRLIAHDASIKKILGYTRLGKIDIGNRVFLGDSVIVLPNVKIGDDAVIGSGSVVTKDIPAGTVTAGSPAKILCSIDEFKERYQTLSQDKPVFDERYLISNLTSERREELLKSVGDGHGFIV